MEKTLNQFSAIIDRCKSLFLKKTKDYGTAWRILRPSSLTDQIFIKAKRIRTIEVKGQQKVDDPLDGEYIGIINYAIMAMIQLELSEEDGLDLPYEVVEIHYNKQVDETKALLAMKNHDYGEAWRDMRISSYTDLILMKLLRVKQIEDNDGKTLVSEGLEANYRDIINYAIFALVKISEQALQPK
ncbi:MAG: DUF1599 domain-containing protein [Bacteroidota bacterium]